MKGRNSEVYYEICYETVMKKVKHKANYLSFSIYVKAFIS